MFTFRSVRRATSIAAVLAVGSFAVAANAPVAGRLVAWGGGIDTPPGDDFIAVSLGQFHGVALRSDGSIASFGSDGGYGNSEVTNDSPLGTGFVAVAASTAAPYPFSARSIAVRSDGRLASWGDDLTGLITDTPGGNGFVAAAAGGMFSVALRADGTLVSWGAGATNGEVSGTPTGGGFTAVSAGGFHGLALRSNGSIVQWGYGFGAAPAGGGFVAISAGSTHSVALRSDGSVVSWGDDTYGQIAGTPTGTGFIAVSAGTSGSVALRANGSVVAWGDDSFAQVTGTPTATGFVAVAVGGSFSMAIHATTPTAQVQALDAAVQSLVGEGADLPKDGEAFRKILDSELKALARDHADAAIAKLRTFIRRVDACVRRGILTSAQGQELDAAAQAILDSLGG